MLNFNQLNLNQVKHPWFALSCLLQGIKLLTHPDLRKYLLIPLLTNIILYSSLLVLGYYGIAELIQYFIPAWLSWLEWILWPLFFISFTLVGFFSFSLLANLIAAPFYSQLSAKTRQIILGQGQMSPEQAWNKVFFAELKRIAYLFSRMLPLLLLFLIPVVNFIAPILWGIFAAWGIAMEYMAYPLEAKGMLFAEQKQFLERTKFSALSFGFATGFGLTLPIVNLFMAQAAIIGATIYVQSLSETTND